MARHSYKLALRAKGVRPLPPYHRLRTRKDGDGDSEQVVVTANEPEGKRA